MYVKLHRRITLEELKISCIELLTKIKKNVKNEKSEELLTELEISLHDILENYFEGKEM